MRRRRSGPATGSRPRIRLRRRCRCGRRTGRRFRRSPSRPSWRGPRLRRGRTGSATRCAGRTAPTRVRAGRADVQHLALDGDRGYDRSAVGLRVGDGDPQEVVADRGVGVDSGDRTGGLAGAPARADRTIRPPSPTHRCRACPRTPRGLRGCWSASPSPPTVARRGTSRSVAWPDVDGTDRGTRAGRSLAVGHVQADRPQPDGRV